MRASDHQMPRIDCSGELLSRFAPEDERDMWLIIDRMDYSRSEFFPSFVSMRMWLMGTYGEHRVE